MTEGTLVPSCQESIQQWALHTRRAIPGGHCEATSLFFCMTEFFGARRHSRSWLGWIVKSRQIEQRDSPSSANRWLAVATILSLSLTENRRGGMMVVG